MPFIVRLPDRSRQNLAFQHINSDSCNYKDRNKLAFC